MALHSSDLPLGAKAPDFSLPDVVTGTTRTREGFADGRPLLVMFLCRHCPYVQHVLPELVRVEADYGDRVALVAISSNDAEAYPEDAPGPLAELVRERGFGFPMLYDEDQSVARAYEAVCTPEFYVFDPEHRLVYHGQLDDSRHKNTIPLSGADLRRALDAVLAGAPPLADQKHAVGCGIKWRT